MCSQFREFRRFERIYYFVALEIENLCKAFLSCLGKKVDT